MTPEEIAKDREIIETSITEPETWESSDRFIAAARTRWPAALDEIERLQSIKTPPSIPHDPKYQETNEGLLIEIERLQSENSIIRKELEEQCWLHGLGANREHALITENKKLKEALSSIKNIMSDMDKSEDLPSEFDEIFHAEFWNLLD